MIAIDTSIAVAAFGEWHELHEPAATIVAESAALPTHALLETYSVLSGFPPPHRAPAGLVWNWLKESFPQVLEPPDSKACQELVARLAQAGRSGGAIYDGLVALTAKLAATELVTADRRAVAVYQLVGVQHRLLSTG